MATLSKAMSFGWGALLSINGTSIKATSSSLVPTYTYRNPEQLTSGGRVNVTTGGRALLQKEITGNIVVEPSYSLAETLISGTFDTVSGTSYGPAADPTAVANRYDIVQKVADTTYTYDDCYVNTLNISAEENNPVSFDIGLIALTEVESGSVSAATDTASPMLMSEATFGIGSDTISPTSWNIEFNRNFQTHSMQSTGISVAGADVMSVSGSMTLTVNSDTMDLISATEGDPTSGYESTFTFTDGSNTFQIYLPHLVIDTTRPEISSGELTMDVPFNAYSPTSSDNRFVFLFS